MEKLGIENNINNLDHENIIDKNQIEKEEGPVVVEWDLENGTKTYSEGIDASNEKIKEEALPVAEKKVFNARIIDTSEIIERQARDLADKKMTESKEDLSGSWAKRNWNRIWKHGVAQEFYRQKEISNTRRDILETGDLYSGEENVKKGAHEEAMKSIVDRFLSEYENDVLRKEELESKKEADSEASQKIKSLIMEYASNPKITKEIFQEEQTRILSEYNEEYANENKKYTDNIFEIANEIKKSIEHGTKIEALDFDLDLKVGKARDSLNTALKKNTFDNLIEKTQNSRIGKFIFNEPVAVSIAAGLYSAGNFLGMRALQSKAGQLASFGATALIASGVTGLKESARLERERVQHLRESAKGMSFEGKRRESFENSTYEMMSSREILSKLDEDIRSLSEKDLSDKDIQNITSRLADVESRIKLGEEKNIDLISYSRFDNLEKERTEMLINRAKLKTLLRSKNPNFDENLNSISNTLSKQLENGEDGLEEKNRLFKKMKRSRVASQMIKTVIVGASVGVVVQEAGALMDSEKTGIFEGLYKKFFGAEGSTLSNNNTALEGLRKHIMGEDFVLPFGNGHEIDIDGKSFHIPDNMEIINNQDGTYDIYLNDKVLVSKTLLDKDSLRSVGINVTESSTLVSETIQKDVSQYLEDNKDAIQKIKRELWFDNDTQAFDKNELKTHWGGENGTGIDSNGDYVLSIAQMQEGGSFHGLEKPDLKDGQLKMIFSLNRENQNQVFEVFIDDKGNAVIPKDSEISKLMFKEQDGKAIFNGKFAEVVESKGLNSEGVESVRVLSTLVGEGVDQVADISQQPIETIRLDIINGSTDIVPPFVPVPGRRPLERGGSGDIKQYPSNFSENKNEPLKNVAKNQDPKGGDMLDKQDDIDSSNGKQKEEASPIVENLKELKVISREKYDAMKDDIEFLNKKIQGHEGIITISRNDLKSELAQDIYEKLKHIPDGKPVTFNKSELREIGDRLEDALSNSRIAKNPLELRNSLIENGLSNKESADLKDDIEFLNKKIQSHGGILNVSKDDFKSDYAKNRYLDLAKMSSDKITTFNKVELGMIGDEIESILTRSNK